jgi:hypothetical protein
MWYVYLRFYIDEDDITAGLDQYCTEWETMAAIGYNYKEYKCFVDNLGGFEHWVGDMSGYISQTREIGFIDGSPSDNVYDSSLLMGKMKLILPDLRFLHAFPTPANLFIRKIGATHADSGLYKYSLSASAELLHNFYVTLDSTMIEKFTYSEEIEALGNCATQTTTVDINKALHALTVDSYSADTDDEEKGVNNNFNNYAKIGAMNGTRYIIYDLGAVRRLHNIVFKMEQVRNAGNPYMYVETSVDKVSYTAYKSHGGTANWVRNEFTYQNIDRDVRYIRVRYVSNYDDAAATYIKIYALMCA